MKAKTMKPEKKPVQLIAANISDEASIDVDEPEGPIDATISPTLMKAIEEARAFMAKPDSLVDRVCLRASGLEFNDEFLGEFRMGYSQIRVYPLLGVYLFMEHKHSTESWVEFEIDMGE